MQNAKQIAIALKNNDILLNKDGKISQKDLNTSLQFVDDKTSQEVEVILNKDGVILRSKGDLTHSEGMKLFKKYVEETLPRDLFEKGKSSFSLNEEVINRDMTDHEKFGVCFLNNSQDSSEFAIEGRSVIKAKINNDNMTLKQDTKKVKDQLKEIN